MAFRQTFGFLFLWIATLVATTAATPILPTNEPIHGFGLLDVFPRDITFSHPVVIASPPGETNALFIAERSGRVFMVTNFSHPEKRLFLDIRPTTISGPGLEPGLLGMAFHPGFRTNGHIYVYRSILLDVGTPQISYYNRLSRFKADPAVLTVDPRSEEIILQQRDYAVDQHNAGDIQFGPDGYLYLSIGDLSPRREDLERTLQPIDGSFFGVILRIDVDGRPECLLPNPHPDGPQRYWIPPDNPFVGVSSYHGLQVTPTKVRTEIYALGFRNPWRFSFDPVSGDLFCGDVGEMSFEEVNMVQAGRNYGWPYFEAHMQTVEFKNRLPEFTSEPPIWNYPHDASGGQAIVGGQFYKGDAIPQLKGAYIFGDNVRGHIWALHRKGIQKDVQVQLLAGEPTLSTFGTDPRDGEVLVANLMTGRIRKLVYRDPGLSDFPVLLSETGLFKNTANLIPTDGVKPYDINVPFWSDHAAKKRWIFFPQGKSAEFSVSNHWLFPEGTIWVKHFGLDLVRGDSSSRRRLETRLVVKTDNSTYGVTYKWNENQSDAILVPPEGLDETISIKDGNEFRSQLWHYPSRSECTLCHNANAGFALGFNTQQLNRPLGESGENQLELLASEGYLSGFNGPASAMPILASSTNTQFSTDYRVRSYLDANCSYCHRPGNPIIARWDGSFHTPTEEKGLLNWTVIPHSKESSYLYNRVSNTGAISMPPIATSEINQGALRLLEEWIDGFPVAPWKTDSFGASRASGNYNVSANHVAIGAYGPARAEDSPSGEFLWQPLNGSVQITAQISTNTVLDSSTLAGIRIASPSSEFFAGLQGNQFFTQKDADLVLHKEMTESEHPAWLRVVSELDQVRFFTLSNAQWELIETISADFGPGLSGGFAVSVHDGRDEKHARFEHVSIITASLRLEDNQLVRPTPANAKMICDVAGKNAVIKGVRFLVDNIPWGELDEAPYTFEFQTNKPGIYKLSAQAISQDDSILTTRPLYLTVTGSPTGAWFESGDLTTHGDWLGQFGTTGAVTPTFNEWPEEVSMLLRNAETKVIQSEPTSEVFLKHPDNDTRVGTIWTGTSLSGTIKCHDAEIRKLSFYFLDPNGEFGAQEIRLFDLDSGDLLVVQDVTDLANGQYFSFLLRGSIRFEITGEKTAALGGVFLDAPGIPLPIPSIPKIPNAILGPGSLVLKSGLPARVAEGTINFLMNGTNVANADGPDFTTVISNMPPGSHFLRLRGSDQYGQSADSPTIPIKVLLPPANAKFLRVDARTQGSWEGIYGKDGFLIVDGATNLPPSITLAPTNHFIFRWGVSSANEAALMLPGTTDRIGSSWTAPYVFTFDLVVEDGHARNVSLYLFDGPDSDREQTVQVTDSNSGKVLSEVELRGFQTGHYYTWAIQGAVQFKVIARVSTTHICGIFLDPRDQPPPISILSPTNAPAVSMDRRFLTELAWQDKNSVVQRIELYSDNRLISEFFGEPGEFALPFTPAGEHWLSASLVDDNGNRSFSAPVLLTGSGGENSATFIRETSEGSGNWKGFYGLEDYVIAGESTNVFSGTFEITPPVPWIWNLYSGEARALQREQEGRIAATWYAPPNETVELRAKFNDGQSHQLSLYFLDYDHAGRELLVRVFDAHSNELLDQRTVTSFEEGKYLSWSVRGVVRVQIHCSTVPPVLSAVFVDAAMDYWQWLEYDFDPVEQDTPELSGQASDPDGDEIPNLVEFVSGSNPRAANNLWQYHFDPVDRDLLITISRARNRKGARSVVLVSNDLISWAPADEHGLSKRERFTASQRITEFSSKSSETSRALFFRLLTWVE